ncbi:hypothetical protein KHQ81_09890 [Mycoplasmatota bacterium]|nr:hypothetical protein KHQ81_09890 [Mycoplasmatota bacterium]
MRKFLKTEIDLIYEQLQPNEEVLWRGKPKLMPNVAFMTTVFLLFLANIMLIVLRYLKLNEYFSIFAFFRDWFLLFLVLTAFGTFLFLLFYANRYYKKMMNIFYVITNTRLVIFDSEKEKIIFSKLYPTVKLLRLKNTIFDSGTIIFDIDIVDDRVIEIGFNNIDDADEVINIIKHQLHHMRNKG